MRFLLPLALLSTTLALAACGGSLQDQNRPKVVAVAPADGAVVPGWLAYVRVRYSEPITVLNPDAVRLDAQEPPEDVDGDIRCRIYPDPSDDRAILIVPTDEESFIPGLWHRLRVQEGAVINGDDHYAIDEFKSEFLVGLPPPIFVTGADGKVYEVTLLVPSLVDVTAPPAGHVARTPVASGGRVWVWLDPVAPGPSLLGTMQPGDATIAVVPLAGEVGVRRGGGLVVSTDGRTVYATAEDPATSRVLVHRVDVATTTEIGVPLVLSPTYGVTPATFKPDIDPSRGRLLVPVATSATGGALAMVDLSTFTEIDFSADPGVNALDLVWGAGGVYVEPNRDVAFVLLENLAWTGFVYVDFEDHDKVYLAEETSFPGTARVGYATGDERWFLQGLTGYSGLDGLIESQAYDINEGFAEEVHDDVGFGPRGSTVVSALLRPPVGDYLYLFTNDATSTTLCAYDVVEEDVEQVDLDPGVDGIQGFDFGTVVPTRVTGATQLRGETP